MKFRCKMNDLTSIRLFYKMMTAVSKVADKHCVLRLNPHLVQIFTCTSAMSDCYIVAEAQPPYLFDEYEMAGYSLENNEIYVEFPAAAVVNCLKQPEKNAKAVRMKLTQRSGPSLCIESELPAQAIGKVRVTTYDVPVKIVSISVWDEITPQSKLPVTLTCNVPAKTAERVLKSVIDRMKNLTNYIRLYVNKDGHLRAGCGGGTDEFDINAELGTGDVLSGDSVEQDVDEEVSQMLLANADISVTVDGRKLSTFLGSQIAFTNVQLEFKHNDYVRIIVGWEDSYSIRLFLPNKDPYGL